jgi:hypothetical protein
MTWQYWILTVGLVIGGGVLFYIFMWVGEKLVQKQIEKEKMQKRNEEILNFNGHINTTLELGE